MTVDIVLGDTRTCEDLISNRITCIDGVPHFLRELNKEAYAPRVISIGPFHNQPCSERLQTMQGIKERYSKYFWQRATVENIANRARSTEDMDLLCRSGIVDSFLSNGNAATLVVNNLHKNILWAGLSTDYCKLCEGLNAFYEDPRHIWKAILKRDYFSTPWRTASTVAVAVLFVLTFIQTVCSILQVLQAEKLL